MTTTVTRPGRHLRHQENWAWRATHALEQALQETTSSWSGADVARGDFLRRLASEAADHIAVGCERREPRPFRSQLGPALAKLDKIRVAWEKVRVRKTVELETWKEVEAVRDRADRLTLGLLRALNRQVEQEEMLGRGTGLKGFGGDWKD